MREASMLESIEIARSEWPEFLPRFGRQHEGWLVNVEIQQDEGLEPMVHQLPLADILVENDDISITVTRELVGRITQWIRSVERVCLERCDGADLGLRVEAASGGLVLLHFRTAMRLGAIDRA
jgi:hypothetical protein